MNYLDYFKTGGATEVFESDTIPLVRYLSDQDPSYLVVPGPLNKKGVQSTINWIDEKNTAIDNKIRESDNRINTALKVIDAWLNGKYNPKTNRSAIIARKYMLASGKQGS